MISLKACFKAHTTNALRLAIRQVGEEWRTCRLHRRSLKKVRELPGGLLLKLNLGCGPNPKIGWVNVDLFDSRADLQLDLREHWPFKDGAVCQVYSEHIFEHFGFHREVPHFLSESLRVLCSGGRFDVGVPDTEWPLRAYGTPGDDYWPFAKAVHPAWCETQLDHLNYHFRQEQAHRYMWEAEHKYAWDEESLTRSLQRAGFTAVRRRQFDVLLDTESRRTGTLYMCALKPEGSGRAASMVTRTSAHGPAKERNQDVLLRRRSFTHDTATRRTVRDQCEHPVRWSNRSALSNCPDAPGAALPSGPTKGMRFAAGCGRPGKPLFARDHGCSSPSQCGFSQGDLTL